MNQPTNLLDRVVKLERGLEAIRKLAGLTSAIISRGGLTLLEDSFIKMVDDLGHQVLYIGPNFDGRQLVLIRREGGAPVLSVTAPVSQPMYWALYDRAGNTLIQDDPAVDGGLDRPYLAFSMHPLFAMAAGVFPYMNIDVSSVASETRLWEGRIGLVSQPRIAISGVFGQATGSNSQTYRLREVAGDLIGTWTPGAALVNQENHFDFQAWMSRQNVPIELTVQASGTGTVACQVFGSWQRGTVI